MFALRPHLTGCNASVNDDEKGVVDEWHRRAGGEHVGGDVVQADNCHELAGEDEQWGAVDGQQRNTDDGGDSNLREEHANRTNLRLHSAEHGVTPNAACAEQEQCQQRV